MKAIIQFRSSAGQQISRQFFLIPCLDMMSLATNYIYLFREKSTHSTFWHSPAFLYRALLLEGFKRV